VNDVPQHVRFTSPGTEAQQDLLFLSSSRFRKASSMDSAEVAQDLNQAFPSGRCHVTSGAANILPGLPPPTGDVDPEQILTEIGRRFPGVMTYFGEFTGSWWALIGNQLLEARTPRAFFGIIASAVPSSWTSHLRPSQAATKHRLPAMERP
jgi:anti-sigma factor RsiW